MVNLFIILWQHFTLRKMILSNLLQFNKEAVALLNERYIQLTCLNEIFSSA